MTEKTSEDQAVIYGAETDLFEFMHASKDQEDWNVRLAAVKAHHQGWPANWYKDVILAGAAAGIGGAEIEITTW